MSYATRLGKGRDGVKFKVSHRKMSDIVPPTPTDKKQNGLPAQSGKKKKGKKEETTNTESS